MLHITRFRPAIAVEIVHVSFYSRFLLCSPPYGLRPFNKHSPEIWLCLIASTVRALGLRGWGYDNRSNILFSNESRYGLEPDNNRVLIGIERGKRNISLRVHERHPYGIGGKMA